MSEELLGEPKEWSHPKNPAVKIFGCEVKPGTRKARGDKFDHDDGTWKPVHPLDYGAPVPQIGGIIFIRPIEK